MPLKLTARQRESHSPEKQEDAEPDVKRPRLEAAEAVGMEPERPYQAFVKSKLRQYLRDNNIHSLVKPTQQEIRSAALPLLCRALRNRAGSRRRKAIDALQLYASEQGWIRPPYSRLGGEPTCNDALIQLTDDAGWLAREIPLPDHPAPKHPPIYYTIDPESKKPVPREDSLIRADYVFTGQGDRITGDHYIYPWRDMKHFPGKGKLTELGWNACYRLLYDPRIKDVAVEINWLRLKDHLIQYEFYPLLGFIFSPHPPPIPDTVKPGLPALPLIC